MESNSLKKKREGLKTLQSELNDIFEEVRHGFTPMVQARLDCWRGRTKKTLTVLFGQEEGDAFNNIALEIGFLAVRNESKEDLYIDYILRVAAFFEVLADEVETDLRIVADKNHESVNKIVNKEVVCADLPASFDVAFSFAGEDRNYVAKVRQALKDHGILVFFDEDYQVHLWGKHLTEALPDIYSNRSKIVVIFVSSAYATKDWTQVEKRAALEHAVRAKREYVLPARFDKTELSGLSSAVHYIDLSRLEPEDFAKMIRQKLEHFGKSLPALENEAKNENSAELSEPEEMIIRQIAGSKRTMKEDIKRTLGESSINVDYYLKRLQKAGLVGSILNMAGGPAQYMLFDKGITYAVEKLKM